MTPTAKCVTCGPLAARRPESGGKERLGFDPGYRRAQVAGGAAREDRSAPEGLVLFFGRWNPQIGFDLLRWNQQMGFLRWNPQIGVFGLFLVGKDAPFALEPTNRTFALEPTNRSLWIVSGREGLAPLRWNPQIGFLRWNPQIRVFGLFLVGKDSLPLRWNPQIGVFGLFC